MVQFHRRQARSVTRGTIGDSFFLPVVAMAAQGELVQTYTHVRCRLVPTSTVRGKLTVDRRASARP